MSTHLVLLPPTADLRVRLLLQGMDEPEISPERHEAEIEAHWLPQLKQFNFPYLGITELPPETTEYKTRYVTWKVTRLPAGWNRIVPLTIQPRLTQAQTCGIPFSEWLWADALEDHSPKALRARALSEAIANDPLLFGIIKTSRNAGMWVLVAKWFEE